MKCPNADFRLLGDRLTITGVPLTGRSPYHNPVATDFQFFVDRLLRKIRGTIKLIVDSVFARTIAVTKGSLLVIKGCQSS